MGGPEGWKATGSSTLPSSVLEALPVLNKTEEQRPLRSPTVVHSQSISSLLRVRAVVWKRGALQPGGPPLRATTALHPRSSPPGMDIEGKGVWKTGNSFMPSYIHSFIHSFIHLLNHSLTQSFVNLLLSLIHSLNHAFMHLINLFTYSLMHSFLPIIHSFAHAFIQ